MAHWSDALRWREFADGSNQWNLAGGHTEYLYPRGANSSAPQYQAGNGVCPQLRAAASEHQHLLPRQSVSSGYRFCILGSSLESIPCPHNYFNEEREMEMTKYKSKVVLSVVLLGLGFFSSMAWAGDVKGKITAQGVRSAENIVVYLDSIPGKTFPAPEQHAAMDQMHLALRRMSWLCSREQRLISRMMTPWVTTFIGHPSITTAN